MGYAYKVVPFIGLSKGTLSAAVVARQLESTISEYARQGWEFYQLSDVNVEVQPGCIAGLFGSTVQYVRFDQLIFRGDSAVVQSSTETERKSAAQSAARVAQRASTSTITERPSSLQSEPRAAQHGGGKYQPPLLPSGKIECWFCGETNEPNKDKCRNCYSPLYEKP
jgi:hypothetical protein